MEKENTLKGITRSKFEENLLIDYENGKVFWKKRKALRVKVGDRAGCISTSGYEQIALEGNIVFTHRIIFFMYHDKNIDGLVINHKNGNILDNRISNLECLTYKEKNIITGIKRRERKNSLKEKSL